MRFIMISALLALSGGSAAFAGPTAAELHQQTIIQQAYAAKHPDWLKPQDSDGARAGAKFFAEKKAMVEKK
jgi:hypothetical protein